MFEVDGTVKNRRTGEKYGITEVYKPLMEGELFLNQFIDFLNILEEDTPQLDIVLIDNMDKRFYPDMYIIYDDEVMLFVEDTESFVFHKNEADEVIRLFRSLDYLERFDVSINGQVKRY